MPPNSLRARSKVQRHVKRNAVPIDEVVRKKSNHLRKLLHKEVKKAKQFEVRKLLRRVKQAAEKDASTAAAELQKLHAQLAAARSADVDRLTAQAAAAGGLADEAAPAAPPAADGAVADDPAVHVVNARILGAKCVTIHLAAAQLELNRLRTQQAPRPAADGEKPAQAAQATAPKSQGAVVSSDDEKEPDAPALAALDKLRQPPRAPAAPSSSFDGSGRIDSGDDSGLMGSDDSGLMGSDDSADFSSRLDSDSGEPSTRKQQQEQRQRAAKPPNQPKQTKAAGKAQPKPKGKKNRLGQRARQRLAEQAHGHAASHLSKPPAAAKPTEPPAEELHPSWAAKRKQHAALAIGSAAPAGKKIKFADLEEGTAAAAAATRGPSKTRGHVAAAGAAVAAGPLHPSWEEAKKRKAEQAQQISLQPQGVKIIFDD